MERLLDVVEKQYEDLKYDYISLTGGCKRVLELTNYFLMQNSQLFNAKELNELKKVNVNLNFFMKT